MNEKKEFKNADLIIDFFTKMYFSSFKDCIKIKKINLVVIGTTGLITKKKEEIIKKILKKNSYFES